MVGHDGSIGLCVPESDRSWCSSSRDNDHRAVTIEVASDNFHPYVVTEPAYNALVDLCTDICRRNGKKRLLWFGDEWKTLSYQPASDEMVMTVHRWFAAKACPGDYLYGRHGEIAEEVTKRLEDEEVTQEQFNTMMDAYLAERAKQPATMQKLVDEAKAMGLTDGYRPMSFVTREECAAMALAAAKV